MKAPLISLILFLCCLVGACHRPVAAARTKPPKPAGNIVWVHIRGATVTVPNKANEEWAITEATFRYQIRGTGAAPCYLKRISMTHPKAKDSPNTAIPDPPAPPTVENISLSDEFMARFSVTRRTVRRASDCDATDHGVVDKHTGQEGGDIYSVGDILWISPTEAEVSGGWWGGTTGATTNTYFLKKINGQWQVIDHQLESIS
jgi:hypothetical protein